MSHRKPIGERMFAVCGTVHHEVLQKVKREAKERRITIAKVVGGILEDWGANQPAIADRDVNQGEMWGD